MTKQEMKAKQIQPVEELKTIPFFDENDNYIESDRVTQINKEIEYLAEKIKQISLNSDLIQPIKGRGLEGCTDNY